MISTIHGVLDLMVQPAAGMEVSPSSLAQVCKVRGGALGHHVNVQVSLHVGTGELLLFSPDGFVGSFRLGDLVVANLQRLIAAEAAERREEAHAPQTH